MQHFICTSIFLFSLIICFCLFCYHFKGVYLKTSVFETLGKISIIHHSASLRNKTKKPIPPKKRNYKKNVQNCFVYSRNPLLKSSPQETKEAVTWRSDKTTVFNNMLLSMAFKGTGNVMHGCIYVCVWAICISLGWTLKNFLQNNSTEDSHI